MTLNWKPIVIAFVIGGTAGFLAARMCAGLMKHHRWDNGKSPGQMLDRFSSKLHLTAEQRQQIGAILEAKRQKLDALRGEIRPKFQELHASTSAEIRRLLNPDQQRIFDEMQAKRDARRKRFRDRWAGPGPNAFQPEEQKP